MSKTVVEEDAHIPWYLREELQHTLLIAPAGCGKTEHLALFCRAVVERQRLRGPERILALSFSKKARAGLQSRVRRHVGTAAQRRVEVRNFHGLAFTLFQQHAYLLGLEPMPQAPRTDWLDDLTHELGREYGLSYWDTKDLISRAGIQIKRQLMPDQEILARMHEFHPAVGAYEQRLQDQGERDFDDVMRLGSRVLNNPEVRRLLAVRHPIVLVDEVQDLTEQQLDMAMAVGDRARIFAGDSFQAIYGWAGAEPERVFRRIRDSGVEQIPLLESWRSSPEVLRMVSATSKALDGPELRSARPDSWGDGFAEIHEFETVEEEATAVLDMAASWLAQDDVRNVGIIARSNARLKTIKRLARARDLDAENWDDPEHSPEVARLLRSCGSRLDPEAGDVLSDLRRACLAQADQLDIELLDGLNAACRRIREQVGAGQTLEEVLASLRVTSTDGEPVGDGLHILSSHKGKGQQFWRVVVVGLEQAILPSYPAIMRARRTGSNEPVVEELRVLHVMLSRAEHALAITHSARVPTASGNQRGRDPSLFLGLVRDHQSPRVNRAG